MINHYKYYIKLNKIIKNKNKFKKYNKKYNKK